MSLLTAVLLTIWLVGIVYLAVIVTRTIKNPDVQDPAVVGVRDLLEVNPTLVGVAFTLVLVTWPITLPYAALKNLMKGNN